MERSIDKRALLAALKDQISAEVARSTSQAVDAAAGATHEENAAEGDRDMRSTEASYVARGHAERVQTLKDALVRLAVMPLSDFGEGDAIASSALVDVASNGQVSSYFLVPAAGGERIQRGDVRVSTLSTTSPLGSALLGQREGDEAEVTTPNGTRFYEVLRVR